MKFQYKKQNVPFNINCINVTLKAFLGMYCFVLWKVKKQERDGNLFFFRSEDVHLLTEVRRTELSFDVWNNYS